jgi:NAD(P)-dependent dehydrogenase (short-subunit alcohol dehydrogenase family)
LHYQYGSERVEVLAGDLGKDFGLGKKAVELAVGRWGRLDALVVNHGGLDPVKKVADSSAQEWRESFDGNVFSAVGLVSLHFFLFAWCGEEGGMMRGRSQDIRLDYSELPPVSFLWQLTNKKGVIESILDF